MILCHGWSGYLFLMAFQADLAVNKPLGWGSQKTESSTAGLGRNLLYFLNKGSFFLALRVKSFLFKVFWEKNHSPMLSRMDPWWYSDWLHRYFAKVLRYLQCNKGSLPIVFFMILSSRFNGCNLLQDYHRFHFPVSGTIEKFVDIPGCLYTVWQI